MLHEILIFVSLIALIALSIWLGRVIEREKAPFRAETWKQGYDAGYKKGAEYVLSAIRPAVERMNDTYRKQAN